MLSKGIYYPSDSERILWNHKDLSQIENQTHVPSRGTYYPSDSDRILWAIQEMLNYSAEDSLETTLQK